MSKVTYCIKDAGSKEDVKKFIENYVSKLDLKNISTRSTAALSDEIKVLKATAGKINRIIQESLNSMEESQKIVPKQNDDDDVLLVGDNFCNIASKELVINIKVFAQKCSDDWQEGVLLEITNAHNPIPERKYWVRFSEKGRAFPFSSKKIAFGEAPKEQLDVGIRIIACCKSTPNTNTCTGVVGEPPTIKNRSRYLIFFDDGYAQYSYSHEIRQVYDQSKFVWEDIKGESSRFLKDYIQQYPSRSMVHLKPGHIIKTVNNGLWLNATVLEVDGSLVKMFFIDSKISEWIYRGSMRLEPLYNELTKAETSQKLGRAPRFSTDPKSHKKKAYVVYTMQSDESISNKNVEFIDLDPEPGTDSKKPVARKSSCSNLQSQTSIEDAAADCQPQNKQDGSLRDIDRSLIPQKGPPKRHKKTRSKCTPKCIINGGDDPSKYKGSNPLLIPMIFGWERKIIKPVHSRKKVVVYIAYCGRAMKNIDDLDQRLMQSDSQLTIDLFSFDVSLSTDHEFVVGMNFCDIKDFSLGKENVAIPCVNSLDRRYPEYIEYSTRRIPGKNVNLNSDPSFLVGCNCTDNCRDGTKCQCVRLTVEATECIPNGKNPKAGYSYRRLKQPIVTGIYECNPNCSCDHRCQNRVIQNGLNLRLQIFKTDKKGWGLRCLDDIPAGGFICVYSGQILTEEAANEDGQLYGDEYLADLDHIDVVEKEKEGYESDVRMDIDDDDNDDEQEEDDNVNDSDSFDWSEKIRTRTDEMIQERRLVARKMSVRKSVVDVQTSKSNTSKVVSKKSKRHQAWLAKTLSNTKQKDSKEKSESKLQSKDAVATQGGTTLQGEEIMQIQPEDKPDVNDKTIGEQPIKTDPNKKCSSHIKDQSNVYMKSNMTNTIETKDDSKDINRDGLNDDDWHDEMYDFEIEIDENEVFETDDVEERQCQTSKTRESSYEKAESNSTKTACEADKSSCGNCPMEVENMSHGEGIINRGVDDKELAKECHVSAEEEMCKKNGCTEALNLSEQQTSEAKHMLDADTLESQDDTNSLEKGKSRKSTRQLYGEETVYIIDAKSIGNLGRYFNHSCNPNIFVQNVFYDTHDLRFPWVAFFASKSIKAGTELTWNYNYEVGSVPGKKLPCYCGSAKCNGRLL